MTAPHTMLSSAPVSSAVSSALSSGAIRVSNLTHAFGERTVLDNLNFSIAPKTLVALLGPNGSGKTTLFRILTTLLKPQSGTASIFDCDVAQSPAAVRAQIGVVFQHPAVDIQLTALENLYYQARLYGLDSASIKQRSMDCLTRVGLADRATERVKAFSGGMKRRLEIAKAILPQPRLLLLDEPDTGLDPSARQQLRDVLLALVKDHGTTILATTHLMEMAEVAQSVALLHQGKLLAHDTPGALCQQIGGDVMTLDVEFPELARTKIVDRLKLPATVVGQQVRIETLHAHQHVVAVVELLGPSLRSLSVGRPTLSDVFFKLTGSGLSNIEAAIVPPKKKR